MGLHIGFHPSACSCTYSTPHRRAVVPTAEIPKPAPVTPSPAMPNPSAFKILESWESVDGCSCVLKVLYEGVTNYEGLKILVYNHALDAVLKCPRLDPHFCSDPYCLSPFARFEPTLAGWEHAISVAESLPEVRRVENRLLREMTEHDRTRHRLECRERELDRIRRNFYEKRVASAMDADNFTEVEKEVTK